MWHDPQSAAALASRAALLSTRLDAYQTLERRCAEGAELAALLHDAPDLVLEAELEVEAEALSDAVEAFVRTLEAPLLPERALLVLSAGRGGAEADWWVETLYGMYRRLAARRGWALETLDEGGSTRTLALRGAGALSLLAPESGIHKIQRFSPFDLLGRRQTSYATVRVLAEPEAPAEAELDPKSLSIETMRAGGNGGQNVNKVESAVRITHLPTGLSVSARRERSQHQNRALALRLLRARLLEREAFARASSASAARNATPLGAVRTYVFAPEVYVRDDRTGEKRFDLANVLDGDLVL